MVIVNTDFITGKELLTIGLVKGSTVQSKHIGSDIGASFKTIVGGEIKGYSKLLETARDVAVQRMIEEAVRLGADAIINLRFMTASVMQGAAEVLAYGTAVKFKN